jgi:hypothetical protein
MHSPSYGKAAEKRAKSHSRPTQEPRLLRYSVVCHGGARRHTDNAPACVLAKCAR